MTTTQNKTWLYEISFIRPILLFLLVSYHAFAPYCGAWDASIVTDNEVYKWLAYAFRAFRLEAFVFVSGYVFAQQILKQHKFASLKQLIYSKFKRLIIPCWVFGLAYALIFNNLQWGGVICGIGHLWYLPCLFWCFILTFLIYRSKIKLAHCIIGLLILATISFAPIPLQLNKAMYYLFFFYLGGLSWKNATTINKYATNRNMILLWLAFSALFILVYLLREYNSSIYECFGLIGKAAILSVNNITKLLLATCGIASLYISAVVFLRRHKLRDWVIDIGNYGYGVYIFHQFILLGLYYYTDLPMVTSYWLPWIGTAIALSGSLLLSWVFRKTKLGRALI